MRSVCKSAEAFGRSLRSLKIEIVSLSVFCMPFSRPPNAFFRWLPMSVPSPEEAERILEYESRRNPGIWVDHSRYAGEAAGWLAAAHPRLDADKARALGLLHDIGRSRGPNGQRHVIEGYRLLSDMGFGQAARVCLTHSYPLPDIESLPGARDMTAEECAFVADFLRSEELDEYDRLITLCDCLSQATGFCLLEKRFVDVALRYNLSSVRLDQWRAIFALRDHFSAAIGRCVYSLLPGIEENTFHCPGPA